MSWSTLIAQIRSARSALGTELAAIATRDELSLSDRTKLSQELAQLQETLVEAESRGETQREKTQSELDRAQWEEIVEQPDCVETMETTVRTATGVRPHCTICASQILKKRGRKTRVWSEDGKDRVIGSTYSFEAI